jgi:hypothetical protein
VSDSDESAGLEELYNQGLLTDDEHQHAVDRLSTRDDGGRRGMPRLIRFWPVLALLVGIGLIIFAVVGTGGGGGGTTKQPGIAVNGVVVISVSDNGAVPDDSTVRPGAQFNVTDPGFAIGKGCHTSTGFSDVTTGASVEITDANGKKLVTTTLKPGVYDSNADCVFGFTAAVPKRASYTIKLAQRNPLTYSQAEMAKGPQLSL